MNIAIFEAFQWIWLYLSLSIYFIPNHKYLRVVLIVLYGLDQPVILQTLAYFYSYFKALVVGYVITQQNGICAVVVSTNYRPESFLPYCISLCTCCIPNLQFDLLVADLHPPKLEIYSDRREEVLVVLAIHELAEQRGLAYVKKRLPTAESPTRTSLYYPATCGIILDL